MCLAYEDKRDLYCSQIFTPLTRCMKCLSTTKNEDNNYFRSQIYMRGVVWHPWILYFYNLKQEKLVFSRQLNEHLDMPSGQMQLRIFI